VGFYLKTVGSRAWAKGKKAAALSHLEGAEKKVRSSHQHADTIEIIDVPVIAHHEAQRDYGASKGG